LPDSGLLHVYEALPFREGVLEHWSHDNDVSVDYINAAFYAAKYVDEYDAVDMPLVF